MIMKLRTDVEFPYNFNKKFYNSLSIKYKLFVNDFWKKIKYHCDICNIEYINNIFETKKNELINLLNLYEYYNDKVNIKKVKFKISLLILFITFKNHYVKNYLIAPITSEEELMKIDKKITLEDWIEVVEILKN